MLHIYTRDMYIHVLIYCTAVCLFPAREEKKNNLWYPFTTYTYKHSPIPETEYNFPAYIYMKEWKRAAGPTILYPCSALPVFFLCVEQRVRLIDGRRRRRSSPGTINNFSTRLFTPSELPMPYLTGKNRGKERTPPCAFTVCIYFSKLCVCMRQQAEL